MAQSPYYASHTWPPHVHREYPKWVGSRLVGSASEEARAIAEEPEHAPPAPVANANDIADLKAQVAALTAVLMARAPSPEPVKIEIPYSPAAAASAAGANVEFKRSVTMREPPIEQPMHNASEPSTPAHPLDIERQALWADCDARGIPYDRRWGVERMRSAVAAADVAEANGE